jgi:hypothetical protein
MENKENNVIEEVTMFDKVYKTKNLTQRVAESFVSIQRMEKEAQEAKYQAVKAVSAVEFQKIQLKGMIEEDEIESETEEEEGEG